MWGQLAASEQWIATNKARWSATIPEACTFEEGFWLANARTILAGLANIPLQIRDCLETNSQ